MFTKEMAQAALDDMTPDERRPFEEMAKQRRMSARDVVLEAALTVAHQASREGLEEMKDSRPKLELVK